MGSNGAMIGKLRRPDVDYSKKNVTLKTKDGQSFRMGPSIIRDKTEQLTAARKTFVAKTGGKLKDVKTAGAYKKMSESTQAKYKKRNPKEFPVGYKLGKQSILGA